MWLKRLLPNCFNMSFNRLLSDRKPLVVVLGATGTGKSKLSLEIAKKYNGEVISADSMQVYKGLDIITNKVTAEERQQAQHHLLDFVNPLQDFHIQQFRDLAVSAIEQLHGNSKLPVVVGGTHYYIESVLWKVLVTGAKKETAASSSSSQTHLGSINSCGNTFSDTSCDKNDNTSKYVESSCSQTNNNGGASDTKHTVDQRSLVDISKTSSEESCSPNPEGVAKDTMPVYTGDNPEETGDLRNILNYTREIPDATEDLYEKLISIDSDRARMLHPKDRRKIIRSLQVWQQTGEKHSVHLRRQQEEAGGNVLGGGLRYPNTVVFWLHSDQTVLDTRLDDRVDVMLQSGLLTELLDFHEHYNKTRLRQAAPSVDAPETTNNSSGDPNVLKGRSSCSGNDDTVSLGTGQKHSASFDANTKNKRLKLDSDNIGSPVTETLLSSAEEAAKHVSSSASVDKHSNNTGDTNGKQCHGSSAVSAPTQPLQADYSQGIFQSIGFKEFHEYLVLPPEEKNSERGEKLRQSGIDLMKLATRRYARRQVKWIKNRFTKDLERPVPLIYRLDVTDPGDWEAAVSEPADAVVAALMAGHPPPHHVIKPVERIPAPLSEIQGRFDRHECTLCSRVFIGREQWRAHIRGAKHKKAKQRKAAALLEEQRAASEDDQTLGEEERQSKLEKDVVEPLEVKQGEVNCSEKAVLQQ